MNEFIKVLKCPKCGAKIKENWLKYQSEAPVCYERQMGAETEYIINCDGYECHNCHNMLKINGSVWEYPEGVPNTDDISVSSCDEENE